jgi:hypothetical protein
VKFADGDVTKSQLLTAATARRWATSLVVPDNDLADFPVVRLPVAARLGYRRNLTKQPTVGFGVLACVCGRSRYPGPAARKIMLIRLTPCRCPAPSNCR